MDEKEVVEAIKSELEYQDRHANAGEWQHQGKPSVAQEILMAEEYMLKSRAAWVANKGDQEALDCLRKVAGILFRTFKNHGVPKRK